MFFFYFSYIKEMDLNMLEIASKNCYKCDLETIIDSNVDIFGLI